MLEDSAPRGDELPGDGVCNRVREQPTEHVGRKDRCAGSEGETSTTVALAETNFRRKK